MRRPSEGGGDPIAAVALPAKAALPGRVFAMHDQTIETIDQLVEHHFDANGIEKNGRRVAAISASHKLHWANAAGVPIDAVEQRLVNTCERIGDADQFAAVPRYAAK